ncbi:MAG: response regulator [Methylacidiphilales bacterium]|nr:response regulator [Candidatus Methylacidiphilales bacterium]
MSLHHHPVPGLSILILDDDRLVLSFLSDFLKHKGHAVTPILDARDLERAVRENKCNAAVVDIRLKGEEGLQFIPKIKELISNGPVIVFTALGYKEEQMQRALKLGATGYVSKLLPPEELYAALMRAFESHAAAKAP